MTVLDVDSVRAFLAIAELRSFTRAAAMLDTTQAGVSVKLKRLEDRLGHRLIERTPRQVRLSAQGAMFLAPAREFIAAHDRAVAGLGIAPRHFALGIAAHVAGPEIPAMLARLNAHDPNLTIELRIDSAQCLLDAVDRGDLDAAIIRREDDQRDGDVLAHEAFGWFAAPHFEYQPGEKLRLAGLPPTCGVRDIATRALDAAGIGWTEVFVGGSPTVMAAVSAGVAVAVLPARVVPADVVEVGSRFGLPTLPASEIVLHTARSDEHSRAVLRALTSVFRA